MTAALSSIPFGANQILQLLQNTSIRSSRLQRKLASNRRSFTNISERNHIWKLQNKHPENRSTFFPSDLYREKNLGGAVIYGGWAAAQCGFKTVIVTTANASECDVAEGFYGSGVTLTVLPSAHTCAIRNVYLSADKERRVSTNTHRADPIRFSDIEDLALTTRAIQLGGLVAGDFEEDILPKLHALS